MDIQMSMLYILILINQIVAYGALVYLAMRGHKESPKAIKENNQQPKPKKKSAQGESHGDEVAEKGKYLDYINKFEVEA